MLNQDELREAVLLVFANKQDLPNAMNAAEITDKLGLHSLRHCHWYFQGTCATSGEGLYEGLYGLAFQQHFNQGLLEISYHGMLILIDSNEMATDFWIVGSCDVVVL